MKRQASPSVPSPPSERAETPSVASEGSGEPEKPGTSKVKVDAGATVTPTSNSSEVGEPSSRSRRPKRNNSASRYDSHELVEQKKKKPKKETKISSSAEEEFESSWICAECKEAECMTELEADQLLICEGQCQRLFHFPCAGLSALPGEDEDYICADCTNKRHACSFCKEYGDDDVDVFRCEASKCGLFFHISCLEMQNVEIRRVATCETQSAPALAFTCPAHSCWTCVQNDLQNQEDSESKEAKVKSAKKGKGKARKSKSVSSSFDCKKDPRLYVSLCRHSYSVCSGMMLCVSHICVPVDHIALHGVPNCIPFDLFASVRSVPRACCTVP